MDAHVTSIKNTERIMNFDIMDGKETYPFQALINEQELINLDSLGYDWNELPKQVQDKSFEFAISIIEQIN